VLFSLALLYDKDEREPSESGEAIIFAPGFSEAGQVAGELRDRIENASAA
jgi:hypothetical protein